jgi:glycosyltransferase involved in cell wall biosynthesis
MIKISIITVAYNAASTIKDTIESVLAQENIELEYIIIDGGSKDGTQDIVKGFGTQISKFISEPDNGIYDGMNKGVGLATGEIIGILNADDVYADQNVLSDVVKSFEDSTQAVYANLVYVAEGNLDIVKRIWVSKPYKEGMFKKGWMPPHPTFFVRKEVYEKFGSYSLELKSAADYEFMLRVIHKNKIKLNYLDRVTVKMRVGGKSNASLKNRLKANQEDRKAWKMNGLKPGAFTTIRKPLSKIGQFLKK